MNLCIVPSGPLRGTTRVPGDKSITHRALMLGAIADGKTLVQGWVPAEVCLTTLQCMRALGIHYEQRPRGDLLIHGAGMSGLREPADVLSCAGSGTTIRLLAGLASGQPFTTILTGSEPLRRRPMARVTEPLALMGATVLGRDRGRFPPLAIRGGLLHGINYELPVASAQVKSAILIAGLFADGKTTIGEPGPSRDHTERMLRWFGVQVDSERLTVHLRGRQQLVARGNEPLVIPGDFSSAAFPLVAGAILPESSVCIPDVGANRTRTGLLDLLAAMGAKITSRRTQGDLGTVAPRGLAADTGEPIAHLEVVGSALRAVEAAGEVIVRAIDEFPIFAVAATQAEGTTLVREAEELRVKESDRIVTVAAELRKMGAEIEERSDGMAIRGPVRLHGARVECHRDHRLAMALAIAGLAADSPTLIRHADVINDSFPGFVETMAVLGARIAWCNDDDA